MSLVNDSLKFQSVEKHDPPLRVVSAPYSQHFLASQSLEFHICILLAEMPLTYVAPTYSTKGGYPVTLLPPPRNTLTEIWPGKHTLFWQLSASHHCHQMYHAAETSHSKPRRWKSVLLQQRWFTAIYSQHLLDSRSLEYLICILPALQMPPIRCTDVFY